jgi:hypothetical protein
VLVDDDVPDHHRLLGQEIVRDEQDTALTPSPLLRRNRYPPDHVASEQEAAGPSSVRRTVQPVGVLAMVIVTSCPSTVPGATAEEATSLSIGNEVAPYAAASESVAT